MPDEIEFKVNDARVDVYVVTPVGAITTAFMYGVSFCFAGYWYAVEEKDGSVMLYGSYTTARRHARKVIKLYKSQL